MKSLIILGVLLLVMGCADIRKFSVEISEQDHLNAQTTRKIAQQQMRDWAINSGCIQCGAKDLLSVVQLEKVQKMDEIVQGVGAWDVMDYQYGCFICIKSRAMVDTAIATVLEIINTVK